MFIDIHVHARTHPAMTRNGQQAYISDRELIARMDALGIEKAVLQHGLSGEFAVQPQSVEEVLSIYDRWPGRFIPFIALDPRSVTNSPAAPLKEILSYYMTQGIRGVGEVTQSLRFDDPRMDNLLAAAESLGLPLTFHLSADTSRFYGVYDEPGLPLLERALKKFPKLTFLAHSQTFWAEIAPLEKESDREGYPTGPIREEGAVVRLMGQYNNLCGDISAGSGFNALTRDEAFGIRFLEQFQDRLFFGTDIALPNTPTPLIDLLLRLKKEHQISSACFDKVSRLNAAKLFGLEG